MATTYAQGKRALGRCERCGDRYFLRELQYDGQQPDLLVCQPCWDPKHPQERLPDVTDPVTLFDPTGDTEKSVANLQVVNYPPFVPGQAPMAIRLGILVGPSAVVIETVEQTQVTTLSLLGLPDVPV